LFRCSGLVGEEVEVDNQERRPEGEFERGYVASSENGVISEGGSEGTGGTTIGDSGGA
jgi:hypothetical protein